MSTITALSSRRTAFGFGAAALAGLTAPAFAKSLKPRDPLVGMFQRFKELEASQEILDGQVTKLRTALIKQNGYDHPAFEKMRRDPRYPTLTRMIEESDASNAKQIDILDAMLATPATSIEGTVAKLKAAEAFWGGVDMEDTGCHERETLTIIRDAIRFLSQVAA